MTKMDCGRAGQCPPLNGTFCRLQALSLSQSSAFISSTGERLIHTAPSVNGLVGAFGGRNLGRLQVFWAQDPWPEEHVRGEGDGGQEIGRASIVSGGDEPPVFEPAKHDLAAPTFVLHGCGFCTYSCR